MYKIASLVALTFLAAAPAEAITLGQIDRFQSGTVLDWGSPSEGNADAVLTGGADGVADGYLSVETFDFHWGTNNRSQWSGDYAAAGVTAIELDVRAFGPDEVNFRLLLFGPGGTWATTPRYHPTLGGGWEHAVFSLLPGDMRYVPGSGAAPGGTGVFQDTLADVTTLLIRNDLETPAIPGNHPLHITTTHGLDNIEAVPEPATMTLVAMLSLLGQIGFGRRRQR